MAANAYRSNRITRRSIILDRHRTQMSRHRGFEMSTELGCVIRATFRDQPSQSVHPEHVAIRRSRFDLMIGVENDEIAGADRHGELLVLGPVDDPEREIDHSGGIVSNRPLECRGREGHPLIELRRIPERVRMTGGTDERLLGRIEPRHDHEGREARRRIPRPHRHAH